DASGVTRVWNAAARGSARMERWLQQQRLVHPCSSTGLVPPAAEEGVNALGFWNAVARGDVCVERGGAGRRVCGTRRRGAAREWKVGCSNNVWFTRAQARA
ncbi:MAG: hypothetical protein QF805_26830, partial [Pirellulaceae bacterium]|nr:hypothetical protein [Pirellulaceae bacterium]